MNLRLSSQSVRSLLVALSLGALTVSACSKGDAPEDNDGSGGNGNESGSGGDGGAGGAGAQSNTGGAQATGIELVSGTRLTARRWSGADTEWFSHIWDTELETPCSFADLGDGQLRCSPRPPEGTTGIEVAFTDSACSEAIGLGYEDSCALAPFTSLTQKSQQKCETSTTRVFRIGESLEAPSAFYILDLEGACVAGTDTGFVFHELTELPPESLVAGEIEIVERTERLGVEVIVAEDGFRKATEAYDLARARPCQQQIMGPTLRPAPEQSICLGAVAYTNTDGNYGFVDASCEALAAATAAPNCGELENVVSLARVGECYERTLFEIGPEIDATATYAMEAEMCAPATSTSYERYFEVGAASDLADFASVEEVHDGKGRLARRELASEGTTLHQLGEAWDTQLEERCYPQLIAGATYCLPSNTINLGPSSQSFADALCTVPLKEFTASSCVESKTPHFFGLYETNPSCSSLELDSLWHVEAFTGDTYYRLIDENCEATPVADGASYLQATEEVDLDATLVRLTISE